MDTTHLISKDLDFDKFHFLKKKRLLDISFNFMREIQISWICFNLVESHAGLSGARVVDGGREVGIEFPPSSNARSFVGGGANKQKEKTQIRKSGVCGEKREIEVGGGGGGK